MSEQVAEVLRAHGIYGFNGSQVRCRCSHPWRELLDWHAHVAEALAPLIAEERAKAAEGAVREAAGEFEGDMADVWGGDRSWLTSGTKVAELVACTLHERADTYRDDRGQR